MTWSQNNAGEYGGAVALVSCSEVSWSGENMTWSQNNAGEYGGAVFVWDSSNMSWSGFDMTWSNNTANHAGAVYMQYSSDVSWSGDMMTWSSNTAHGDGGAVGMRLCGDVTWSGEMMTWSYNTALDGDGGAIYMWDGSDVSWSGGMMTWSNNTALNEYGGAVYMSASWGVSWSGDVMTWSNNAAYYPGGAVCIDNSWDVTWSGEMMTWSNNTAAWNGGAVYLSHSLHVSWRGFSMTWSNNNALDRDGGAVYISHSWYVSWSGINTTWSNNTADGDGGSVYMSASSGVSWSGGMMTWSNNTALHGDGGAVYISTSSNVSWNGKMMAWSNNTAYGDEGVFGTSGGGGAVYISTGSSNVSWSGDMMTWSDNTAFGDGGAVGILSCSNVSWSGGMMTWSDNTALHGDGGAVCISTSSDVSWSGSNMTWSYNTASLNGGAIYAFSSTTSTFNSSLFEGNTASGAGGAVMLSGVATGLEFVQVNFIANSSPRGGAVYSVSSGIETDQGGNQDYPVVYRGCSFADNRASATGGALESIAGLDRIEGTTYERNSAGAGGALRLGGDANVSNCDFTNNSAKEEGPAISNHGVLHLESGLSRFSGNVFWCEYGTYLDGEDGSRYQTVCDGCPGNNGDGIVSVENEDVVPVCVEQLDNTRSEGGDTTIETLELIKGHWRTTKNSDKILSCYNEDACTGGMTDDPAFCQQGYNGSYCSVCSEGYYSSLAFTCNKCMGDGGGIALMVIVGVLVLGAAVGVCTYLVSAETEGARRGVLLRVVNRLPLQSIKIVVVVWQILTQFASVANVTFPDVYQRFLDGVDILNFDALWIPSAGCVVDFDFHDRLLVSTIAPLIALALLATTYLVAKRRNLGSEAALQKVVRKHLTMAILISFLIYSSVSATVFQTFACDDLDKDRERLRADYRIECDSSKHRAFQIYAGIMIFVYPVGIPLFYAYLLYKNRQVLRSGDEVARDTNPQVQPFSDLWLPYKPGRYYYELIECLRRISLTGIIVFIFPNSAPQVAVTLMIAFSFVVISLLLTPYVSKWDASVYLIGHVVVFTSMYTALLGKVNVSRVRADSQEVFAIVLVASHVCMVLAVVVETVLVSCSMRRPLRDW